MLQIVATHSTASDCFLFAVMMWETLTLSWNQFRSFFSEGRGLTGKDIRFVSMRFICPCVEVLSSGSFARQVTKPGNKRQQTDDKRGLVALNETVYCCTLLRHQDRLAELVTDMVSSGLQQVEKDRPTMEELKGELWQAWKTSVAEYTPSEYLRETHTCSAPSEHVVSVDRTHLEMGEANVLKDFDVDIDMKSDSHYSRSI